MVSRGGRDYWLLDVLYAINHCWRDQGSRMFAYRWDKPTGSRRDCWYVILDSGFQIPGSGFKVLDSGFQIPGSVFLLRHFVIIRLLLCRRLPALQSPRLDVCAWCQKADFTNGWSCETMIRPVLEKVMRIIPGFSRQGAWVSLPKNVHHQRPSLSLK